MNFLNKISEGVSTRLYNSLYTWENINTALFTGTGRIGTMFFSNFFNEYFQSTKAIHEPWPDLQNIGYNYHHLGYSYKKTLKIIKRERSKICRDLHKIGINNYLESNYNLSYLLPFLEPLFGDFKLVHLIREPKSYLVSIYSVEEVNRHIYAPFDDRKRISAMDFENDPFHNKWSSWTRFEKLCWHYYKVNTLLGDFAEENPDKVITVRFEDIFDPANNFSGLFKIIDFLGFSLKEGVNKNMLLGKLNDRANKTKRSGIKGYSSWSSNQKEIFHEITDPVFSRFYV